MKNSACERHRQAKLRGIYKTPLKIDLGAFFEGFHPYALALARSYPFSSRERHLDKLSFRKEKPAYTLYSTMCGLIVRKARKCEPSKVHSFREKST